MTQIKYCRVAQLVEWPRKPRELWSDGDSISPPAKKEKYMNVFVVYTEEENTEIIGVFDNYEKADKARNDYVFEEDFEGVISIEERKINETV